MKGMKTIFEVYEEFSELTDSKKINVLHEALETMHGYNGHSPMYCIAQSMGYENIEGSINTWTKAKELDK